MCPENVLNWYKKVFFRKGMQIFTKNDFLKVLKLTKNKPKCNATGFRQTYLTEKLLSNHLTSSLNFLPNLDKFIEFLINGFLRGYRVTNSMSRNCLSMVLLASDSLLSSKTAPFRFLSFLVVEHGGLVDLSITSSSLPRVSLIIYQQSCDDF